MVDVAHSTMTGTDLHEPKGAATATEGYVYVADGVGSGAWTDLKRTQQGIYDYNDLTTASTPISLAVADTQYELTNDGAGPFTNLGGAFDNIANLWDVNTDRFTWSGLNQYDTVDIRFDVEYTTSSVNTAVDLFIELGVGGTPYQLPILTSTNLKDTGTYEETVFSSFYMGDANTLNNPGRLLASADKTGVTVKVNGWYIRGLRTV